MDPQVFGSVPKETLTELQRQAELQLAAQLQSGIGADARALSFISLMAAASVVVAGGGVALKTGSPSSPQLALACFGIVVGFLLSMILAVISARPTGFDYAGSWPSDWCEDITGSKPLERSIADQMIDYDERLRRNNLVLKKNARWMRHALSIAVLTLLVGCSAGGYLLYGPADEKGTPKRSAPFGPSRG